MLVSSSRWERGSASVATTLVLGQRNRTHIVRRRGLMFDTRFLVGAGAPRPCGTLHFLLEGELAFAFFAFAFFAFAFALFAFAFFAFFAFAFFAFSAFSVLAFSSAFGAGSNEGDKGRDQDRDQPGAHG